MEGFLDFLGFKTSSVKRINKSEKTRIAIIVEPLKIRFFEKLSLEIVKIHQIIIEIIQQLLTVSVEKFAD
ncbi:hypothetical protein NG791_05305 [Laspinema sp. D1]|nr:hypothetical protein [Laspinema sp. D2b]